MKPEVFNLARLLMSEQRYRAVKDSSTFSSEDTDKVKRKLVNFLTVSYLANSTSFAVFAFLLITPYIFTGGNLLSIANIGFIAYLYALIISVYSSALFFNSIKNMSLMEPVSPLPFEKADWSVFLSWFIYNGSSSIFVILPSTIWFTIVTANPAVLLFGLIWALIFIMAGYSIGALLSVFLTGRREYERAGIFNTLKSSLRILIILLVFALFEIGIYLPNMVPSFIANITFPENMMVPLLNIPYTVYLGDYTLHGIMVDAAVCASYFALTTALLLKINTSSVGRMMEGNGLQAILTPDYSTGFRSESLSRSMFLKEVRIVARKSQNVVLLFVPVIFVFPTILSVLINGSPGGIESLGTYFSLISVLIVCSGFYSLIMVVSEGNGISTLFSLPVSVRDIIYSKATFGLLVFAVIITPVTLLIMGSSSSLSPYDILVPANLILGYTYSSIYNIRKHMMKLPRESTTVNFYSFGGGLFLVITFLVTAGLVLAPVLGSTVITLLISKSLFSNPYLFYLADSFLNITSLSVVFLITNRTGSTSHSERHSNPYL